MYRFFIRPLFFLLPPEKAHQIAMHLLRFSLYIPGMKSLIKTLYNPKEHPIEVAGIGFKNPVGLAAGFDKDAKYVREIEALGFGFMEIGTVTPRPQYGNPKPRLFRIKNDNALINRMGFNNDGVDIMVERLQKIKNRTIILGGNIGKNKATPNEKAAEDYRICLAKLHPYVDFFVVNVSSPNTPNLRALQEAESLNTILSTLQSEPIQHSNPKPIFLKIAPDLHSDALPEIVEVCAQNHLAGIIATNTTISRSKLRTPSSRLEAIGAGGLSGKPLHSKAVQFVQALHSILPEHMTLIGVGGIQSQEDLKRMEKAGAQLFEVFTGFIYQGPALIRQLLK